MEGTHPAQPLYCQVPPVACKITKPLRQNTWCHMLTTHPDRNLVEFFIEGITSGFQIGFNYTMTTLRPAQQNLESANTHPSVVTEYLKAELHKNRISGPYGAHVITGGHTSRFCVIPKHHQSDKWRLIVELSHPKGYSVNDGIPESLCSLSTLQLTMLSTRCYYLDLVL